MAETGRAAWIAAERRLRESKPLRRLAYAVLALHALGLLLRLDGDPRGPVITTTLAAAVLALGLGAGGLGQLRAGPGGSARAVGVAVFLRMCALAIGFGAGLLAVAGFLALPWSLAAAQPWLLPLRVTIAGWLWLVVLFGVATGTAAVIRHHDVWATILLLYTAAFQGIVLERLGGQRGQRIVEWLLPPLDGLGEATEAVLGGATEWASRYALQLALYPTAWLALAVLRARRLERGARRGGGADAREPERVSPPPAPDPATP